MVFNLDRYDEPGSHMVSLYDSLAKQKKSRRKDGGNADGVNTSMAIQWPGTTNTDENAGGAHGTKRLTEGPFVFYFDSTGSEAPVEIKTLIHRIQNQGRQMIPRINIKSYNNNGQDHQKSNTECGMYSLFFLITMLTGNLEKDKSTKVLDFDEKIKLFRNANIPDKYVEMYRHTYFNTPVH
jgi:hypothetical protein